MSEIDNGSIGELEGEVFGVDTAESDEAEDDGEEQEVDKVENEIGWRDNDDDGGEEDMDSDGVDARGRGNAKLLASIDVFAVDNDTDSAGNVDDELDDATEKG